MARYEHLPIYREAFEMLVYLEKIVRNFSRYDKYTHGTALRQKASEIVSLVVLANATPRETRLQVLRELALRIEEMKVLVRVCKELKAFHNFNSFVTLINHVVSLAMQNEGWMRSLQAGGKRPESLPASSSANQGS